MPLHGEPKLRRVDQLERLDHAVGRARDHAQFAGDAIDGLMVPRAGDQRIAGDPRELRAGRDREAMLVDQPAVDVPVNRTAVRDARAEHVGNVLMQRAAEGNVRNLQSAADRQHRQLPFERRVHEREFVVIARGGSLLRKRVRRSTVVRRIDILAAGEDQPI